LRRGGGELVVRERVVRESTGSATYPTLTRSNYAEWAMVMRVQLQAQHLWDVIQYGAEDDGDDRAALAALLRAVPPELVHMLAVKDCAKTAWEAIKTMCLGCERVREAKAQTRRREWEHLRFKAGETIEEFAIRLTAMNDLELLGDPVNEYKAVLKYLRAVPRKYRMLAMAIEQTVNLWELTIEELTSRFATAEEGYKLDDVTDGFGKLLLTEEEWAAQQHQRGGSSSDTKPTTKPKPQGNQGGQAPARKVRPPASERRGTAAIAARRVIGPRNAIRRSAIVSAASPRISRRWKERRNPLSSWRLTASTCRPLRAASPNASLLLRRKSTSTSTKSTHVSSSVATPTTSTRRGTLTWERQIT
jgi:hypothetical protein